LKYERSYNQEEWNHHERETARKITETIGYRGKMVPGGVCGHGDREPQKSVTALRSLYGVANTESREGREEGVREWCDNPSQRYNT
jgi:hypothetical protein